MDSNSVTVIVPSEWTSGLSGNYMEFFELLQPGGMSPQDIVADAVNLILENPQCLEEITPVSIADHMDFTTLYSCMGMVEPVLGMVETENYLWDCYTDVVYIAFTSVRLYISEFLRRNPGVTFQQVQPESVRSIGTGFAISLRPSLCSEV